MQTIVIHHSADFDGIFCREIARRALGDTATYIGWDYGDPVPEVPDDADLYMLDISIEPLMSHPRLKWIDHHKSAINRWGPGGTDFSWKGDRHAFCLDGVAACRLAWQWFFNFSSIRQLSLEDFVERRVEEPRAVRLAGEYDIWDKRDPLAELFQFGLRSCEPDFGCLLSTRFEGATYVEKLLEAGRSLQFARTREYEQVIKEQGFTIQWEGLTFLACNSHELDIRSHLFDSGIRPEHDALMGFTWNGVQKAWRFSLYGVPGKPEIDVSAIAIKYGGGGHKQACGFRVTELPFPLN